MQIESCGDPRARSRAGAMGLFQVMPYHFAGGDDPYNPDTNAVRGLAYLKRSLDTANGDPRLALASVVQN
jgi:soluble lytic murein transglycosylase-like protein